jgi:EmrB/QacA subfamily drug resistance transporter
MRDRHRSDAAPWLAERGRLPYNALALLQRPSIPTPMDAQTDPHPAAPLTHRETRLIVLGVLLPVFMGSIDQTILASALPSIGRDLGEVANLPWLVTAYLLASTAIIPLYGKIADIRGRRYTLRIAIAVYLIGSLLCALAPSMLTLIIGRALQGLGGGGLTALSVTVLGDIAAPKERGRYYAYFSATYTTAGATGPVLGGFLAEQVHWSAIFWLNIPLALLGFVVTETLLRKLPRHERPHRLDVIGALLIVIASLSFMLGLNIAGVRYPWLSPPVLGLFSVALLMGAAFVLRLLTAPEPLIPIAILRNPVVCWTVIANAFGWGSIIGLNVFLPMYLQSALGLSPTYAGASLIVMMVALNLSAGVGSVIVGRVQHYKIIPLLMLLVAIGAVLTLAWRVGNIGIVWFELLLILIGLGFGQLPSVTSVALQNAVPRHQLGISVATMNFSRNLLSTMLVSLFGVLVLSGVAALDVQPRALYAPEAFGRIFFATAGCLIIAFVALFMIEEKPLRSELHDGPV